MRTSGLLILGLGIGLGAGFLATDKWDSPALVWLGLGLIVLSSVLLGMSSGRAPAPVPDPGQPTLAGLGPRVEKILQLAEEQAADKIRSAEAEAERIITEARTRAGQTPD